MKTCPACKVSKPLADFHRNKWMKDGLQTQCVRCHRISKHDYKTRNPERVKKIERRSYRKYYKTHQEHFRAKGRADYLKLSPEKVLFKLAKQRARAFGVPFTLKIADIRIPEYCPVLGIPLKRQLEKPSDCSPTIDRLVPLLGYTRSNIVVVSYQANAIKRNATAEQLLQVAQFYLARGADQDLAS